MVLQNYQSFTEITSNMIYIVAFGVGLKCPRKIHLNTQWGGGDYCPLPDFGKNIIEAKPFLKSLRIYGPGVSAIEDIE